MVGGQDACPRSHRYYTELPESKYRHGEPKQSDFCPLPAFLSSGFQKVISSMLDLAELKTRSCQYLGHSLLWEWTSITTHFWCKGTYLPTFLSHFPNRLEKWGYVFACSQSIGHPRKEKQGEFSHTQLRKARTGDKEAHLKSQAHF